MCGIHAYIEDYLRPMRTLQCLVTDQRARNGSKRPRGFDGSERLVGIAEPPTFEVESTWPPARRLSDASKDRNTS